MQQINKGPTTSLGPPVTWRKSHYSNPCGSCVEMRSLADGRIAIRNSRHPNGPILIYSPAGMTAFIDRVRVGQFDGATDGVVA